MNYQFKAIWHYVAIGSDMYHRYTILCTIENIDSIVKENAKYKKACNPQHPGTPEHNKKTKPTDYRYRREQGFTT